MKSELKSTPRAGKGRVTAVLMGVLMAYVITCIFFIGSALALTYWTLSEEMVPTVMLVAVAISVVVAGFDAARGAEKNGWLWGMAAGLLYAIILICIETWVSDGLIIDSRTVTSTALAIAGGGFGGVFGINFKKK